MMNHDDLGCQIQSHNVLGLLKETKWMEFAKGAHGSPKIINSLNFLTDILHYMKDQRPVFEHIAYLDILNKINGFQPKK